MLMQKPNRTTLMKTTNYPPNFANFKYKIAIRPDGSRVRAWDKLQECERRLEMYKWIERQTDPASAQHRILLNDTVSSFLLTFEATLQFISDQFSLKPSELGNWLVKQPQYDVSFRGLRTLRHFEAHVEVKETESSIVAVVGGTAGNSITRTWKLPQLQRSELDKLKNHPLKLDHLSVWNTLVMQSDIERIFTDNLLKLKEILAAAEALA